MSSVTLTNARIIGHNRDELKDVVVRDGKIISIELSSNSSAGQSVDVGGRFVGPSLADAHTHFTAWTLNQNRVNLSSAVSASEAIELMRQAASSDEQGQKPLVGRDFRVGKWPDIEMMTRQNLDAIVPDGRPVALISGDLHSIWLNTAAFRLVGVDPEGQDGVLFEKPAFDATGVINNMGEGELFPLIMSAAQAAARRGVTSIVDLEMKHNIPNWIGRIGKGFDLLRVEAGMYTEHLQDAIAKGLKTGDTVPGAGDLLTVGPYKIITDGSLGARTAFCCQPYPGTSDYGLWIYEDATLQEMLEYGVKHNLRLAVHAIGDKANKRTLSAFAALDPPPRAGSSIEHAQLLLLDEDLALFGKLGIIASIQPEHLCDDIDLCERFWPGMTHRAFPYRSLVDAGAKIRLGSDCPVAPLEPWGAMAAAVSRERAGYEGQGAFHAEQRLTNLEAFQASTWNNKVSIEVGDIGDICIVDNDPLTATAKELRSTKVLGTLLSGRFTHREGI